MVAAFADLVVHVTFSGKMLSGSEEWQTGFYLGFPQGAAGEPTQTTADAIRDAWVTFFTNGAHGINTSYSFEQVKLARLNTAGKYDGSDVITSFPATPKAGGAGGAPMPPQCALVATLIGGSGKGLAGKGRMYLPGVSWGIDNAGKIGSNGIQAIATGLGVFFNTVRDINGPEGVPINASKGSKAALYLNPRNVPINGVRVGNVYDTQRRRRGALEETYSVSGLIE